MESAETSRRPDWSELVKGATVETESSNDGVSVWAWERITINTPEFQALFNLTLADSSLANKQTGVVTIPETHEYGMPGFEVRFVPEGQPGEYVVYYVPMREIGAAELVGEGTDSGKVGDGTISGPDMMTAIQRLGEKA